MKFYDFFKIAAAIIISIGGSGGIIAWFANYIGKIWADRLMEKERFKYQEDIEKLKKTLAEELEKVKLKNSQIECMSKVQFEKEF
jgi:hypothetical protein